jgi:hypothetical protein
MYLIWHIISLGLPDKEIWVIITVTPEQLPTSSNFILLFRKMKSHLSYTGTESVWKGRGHSRTISFGNLNSSQKRATFPTTRILRV